MPLDPIIANPAKFDSGDRLADFSNYLLAANRQEAMNAARREQAEMNALNGAYKDSGGDRVKLKNYLLERNLGRMLPAVEKAWAELDKTAEEINYKKAEAGWKNAQTATEGAEKAKKEAEATKTTREAYETAIKTYKQDLDAINPDVKIGAGQYKNWILHKYDDDLMGKILREGGHTPAEELAQLERVVAAGPQAFQQFLMQTRMGMEAATKNHFETQNLGNHVVTLQTKENSFGPQTATKVADNVRVPDPKMSVHVNVPVNTQVMTSAGKSMMETMAEKKGERMAALETLNENAPAEIAMVDKTLKMLQSGDVITGWGAEQRTQLMAMAKTLGFPVNDAMLKNTQLMRQTLGQNLMGRIAKYKADGVSLTPMSNLDLDNFQKSGPQMFDDNATLIEAFQNYRDSIQQGVARYEGAMGKKSKSPVVGGAVRDVIQPDAPTKVPPAPAKKPLSPAAQKLLKKHGH